jgi:hypothetical protein
VAQTIALLKAGAGNPVKLYFPELSVVAYIAGKEKTTVAPEIGAEVVLSVTCPVSDMGVGGVGEGAGFGEAGEGEGNVAVLLPPLHADANVRSRTTQPRLNIGISASGFVSQLPNPWVKSAVTSAEDNPTVRSRNRATSKEQQSRSFALPFIPAEWVTVRSGRMTGGV